MKRLYLLLLLPLLVACQRRPDYVLDDKQMTHILIDVHRSEALIDVQADQFKSEEEKRAIMGAVLVRNGVPKAQYDSSLVWYGQHLKYLVRIYNRVADSLEADRAYWQQVMDETQSFGLSDSGDSVSLWRREPYAVLDARRLSHFRDWQIPTDTAFHKGDSIVWHLRLRMLAPHHFAVATMALCYDKDSVTSHTALLRQDTLLTMGLAADSASLFNSVMLTVSLLTDSAGVDEQPAFLDSINVVRLHRK